MIGCSHSGRCKTMANGFFQPSLNPPPPNTHTLTHTPPKNKYCFCIFSVGLSGSWFLVPQVCLNIWRDSMSAMKCIRGLTYKNAFVLIYANTPGTTSHICIMDPLTLRPPNWELVLAKTKLKQITSHSHFSYTLHRPLDVYIFSLFLLLHSFRLLHGLMRILPCSNSHVDIHLTHVSEAPFTNKSSTRMCSYQQLAANSNNNNEM